MNYRHAYHAGNFADVMKHTALVAVLLHLRKKQAPFAVIDTHAGRGLYDLSGTEAGKTGEARQGIASLGDAPAGNEVLQTYLDTARSFGSGTYPGSPLIAAHLLRPQDRLVAIEKHPEECEALTTALKPFHKTRAVCADGYERLAVLLPPPERRGAILIDPPFEAPDEFAQMADALGKPEWKTDKLFSGNKGRAVNRDLLNAAIDEVTVTRTSEEWTELLNAAGVPAGPIYSIDQMFADPQVKQLGQVKPVHHKGMDRTLDIVGPALQMSRTPSTMRMAAPDTGDATADVLKGLGFDSDRIAALKKKHAV